MCLFAREEVANPIFQQVFGKPVKIRSLVAFSGVAPILAEEPLLQFGLKLLVMGEVINADVDVSDIEVEDDEMTVYVVPSDLHKAQEAIDELIPDCEYSVCAIKMLPQEYVTLEDEHDKEMWNRLLTLLDEVEDVQEVYHNVIL